MSVLDPAVWRTCCLILCFVAGTRQLSISEFIVPKLAEAGNDIELKCSYELGNNASDSVFVKWWWTPPPSSGGEKKQLYQRGPDHQPQSLQHKIDVHIEENDTITLLNVNPIATGIYECEVSEIDEDRKHQELIVFSKGNGPQLNISEVEDGPDEDNEVDVLIDCTTEDAAPLPDLVITINGEVMNTTKVVVGPDSLGFYDASANLTISKNKVDGADIRCELLFENADIVHTRYIDTEEYHPSGGEVSSMKPPIDRPAPDANPEPFQNSPDGVPRVQFAGVLVAWAALLHVVILF